MDAIRFLDQWIQAGNDVTNEVTQSFGKLSTEQLNWKPSPEKWSIGECLDHLIVSNTLYFETFEAITENRYTESLWAKLNPFGKFFGNLLLKGVDPRNTKKMKNPSAFSPSMSNIDTSIIQKFEKHQRFFLGFFEKMKHVSMDQLKIVSPASPVITYRLTTGIEILILHEQRHVLQAKNVMKTKGFPKQ